MSIGNTFETDLLALIFEATAIANMADNAASSPHATIAVSLHTSDPGEAGTLQTNEATYTNYGRASVTRGGAGFTTASGSTSPDANIDFAAGTGGSGTVTHCAFGAPGGGAAKLFFSGTVTPNIVTGNGVTPRLTTATTITLD
jgi:hypothetical protein